MKLEKLNAKKFRTLENTELNKAIGGSTNVHRTRGTTKLLGVVYIDTFRDRG